MSVFSCWVRETLVVVLFCMCASLIIQCQKYLGHRQIFLKILERRKERRMWKCSKCNLMHPFFSFFFLFLFYVCDPRDSCTFDQFGIPYFYYSWAHSSPFPLDVYVVIIHELTPPPSPRQLMHLWVLFPIIFPVVFKSCRSWQFAWELIL